MTADEIGRITVFDYTKVGAEQSAEQSKAAPAHVVFQHSGHRGTVWDIQWNRPTRGRRAFGVGRDFKILYSCGA